MKFIKIFMHEICPPIVWKSASKLYSKYYKGKQLASHNENMGVLVNDIDSSPVKLKHLAGTHGFRLSADRFRYAGGLAYNELQQPFMLYYKYGEVALKRYYEEFQPYDIFEKHLVLNDKQMINKNYNNIPWIDKINTEAVRTGEKGLLVSDGVQQYGPVSQEKLFLEIKRLDELLVSIGKKGYLHSLANGYPRGYFLLNNEGDFVFHILGGQHRVAAMVSLGYKDIICSFQPCYPRIVKESESKLWPAVVKGCLDEESALKIFHAFFRSPEIEIFTLLKVLKSRN